MRSLLKLKLLILCLVVYSKSAAAADDLNQVMNTDISKMIGAINDTIPKQGRKVRQYVALGGYYTSDQDSTKYNTNLRYERRSVRGAYEFGFIHEAQRSRKYRTQKEGGDGYYQRVKNLYDIQASGKTIIGSTENYFNLFGRRHWDKLNTDDDYGSDKVVAVGLGRILDRDRYEIDLNIGRQYISKFSAYTIFMASMRLNFNLSDKINFVQRGYYFRDCDRNTVADRSVADRLQSIISYRFTPNSWIQLIYQFDQNIYRKNRDGEVGRIYNETSRLAEVGIKFDI